MAMMLATVGAGSAPRGAFTVYAVPAAAPHGIVYNDAGPLKGVWFTNATLNATSGAVELLYRTGKTTFYPTPSAAAMPGSINYLQADGSLWFTETNGNRIAVLGLSRKITEYAIPTPLCKPLDITRGPDGAMWFTESAVGKIGRVDRRGAMTEYRVGPANDEPTSLISQDGALWFTEVGTGRIGRLTPAGNTRHFPIGPGRLTGALTNTSDGALWAGKHTSLVRFDADGSRKEYDLPAGIMMTGAIFGREDGVYLGAIKRDGQGAILSVSTGGRVREYDLPSKHVLPIEMAVDPDGGFFMTVEKYPSRQPAPVVLRLQ